MMGALSGWFTDARDSGSRAERDARPAAAEEFWVIRLAPFYRSGGIFWASHRWGTAPTESPVIPAGYKRDHNGTAASRFEAHVYFQGKRLGLHPRPGWVHDNSKHLNPLQLQTPKPS